MMIKAAAVVLSVALLQDEVSAAVAADKVNTLPGFAGPLPSQHYSGYMPVGNLSGSNGHLHYWLIESEVIIKFCAEISLVACVLTVVIIG